MPCTWWIAAWLNGVERSLCQKRRRNAPWVFLALTVTMKLKSSRFLNQRGMTGAEPHCGLGGLI